jgi:putative nucleotidyltransferase with HDIG domain
MAIGRILIVDDEPDIRGLLKDCAQRCGYEAQIASSAHEAMQMLDHAEAEFDLMISDVRMPDVDGMELLRWSAAHHGQTGVIMLSGCDDLRIAVNAMQLGALDYLQKPFQLDEVAQTLHEAMRRHRERLAREQQVLELESALQRKAGELQDSLNRLQSASEGTLEALVTALDAREHEVQAHSERVSQFTVRLAQAMGVQGADLELIRKGAMLHDIGKIGISDLILLKPGPLSAEEWTEMRKHPMIGAWIVNGVDSLRGASHIVLSHHEKFDGTGYPRNLRGLEIPLGARVFSVADTFDAMTSNRPYHQSRSTEEAREEIRRHAGSQFDPEVVERFLEIPVEVWDEIRERTLNTIQDRGAMVVI